MVRTIRRNCVPPSGLRELDGAAGERSSRGMKGEGGERVAAGLQREGDWVWFGFSYPNPGCRSPSLRTIMGFVGSLIVIPMRYFLPLFYLARLGWGLPSVATAESGPDFSREILPILSDKCFQCHGPDANHREADLRLDVEAEAKASRDGYPVIVPGRSAESELIYLITSDDDDERMPPRESNKSLTAAQKTLLAHWIDHGAQWGQNWAFGPLEKPAIPAANFPTARNEIDRLVGAKLRAAGLAPMPEAERAALIRRVTLDLTGLPPIPADVAAFGADQSPEAFAKVVDRLLASSAYGERMAWDWMEIARYADTNGYQQDNTRTMWPWRDWVVQAFNENLPYDEFTIWQLAGDLLPEPTTEQIMATAFLRNYPINGEGGRIAEENRVDYVLDMTDTTGTVWLGLTMGCARCHDHKFDPISQQDYYAFSAYFNQTPVNGKGGDPQTKPVLDFSTPEQHAAAARYEEFLPELQAAVDEWELTVYPREVGEPASKSLAARGFDATVLGPLDKSAKSRGAKQLARLAEVAEAEHPDYALALRRLRAVVAAREAVAADMVRVMVMGERPEPRETFVLDRGLYNQPLGTVTAAVPASLPAPRADAPANRLGLAQWLVADENPLTARVTVNRWWQMLFGIGLVKTPEDFGVQGEVPLQAELLDWLAAEFRDSGWDVKHILRTMVMSATYRQSARWSAELREQDPDNRLLARGPRFRMPAWMIRDQALAVSGLLVDRPGGPGVFPYQPAGVWAEASFSERFYEPDTGDSLYRRSLYTFWRRTVGPTLFFDTAARFTCTVNTPRTNTPLHALALLNDPTFVEAARVLAARAIRAEPEGWRRLDYIYRRVLARSPDAAERAVLFAGLGRHFREFAAAPDQAIALLAVGEWPRAAELDPVEQAAWTLLCLSVLNFDETLNKG